MGKRDDVSCNDCYFRRAGLCALPGDEPCPTFRLAKATLTEMSGEGTFTLDWRKGFDEGLRAVCGTGTIGRGRPALETQLRCRQPSDCA